LTDDPEKKEEAEGFLAKLTDPEFYLTLTFLQDVLTLLTQFSKLYQKDSGCLHDYYNNTHKLLHILENLSIKRELSSVTKEAFPNYSHVLNDTESTIIIPPRQTRSSNRQFNFIYPETLLKKHNDFLRLLHESIKARFSYPSLVQSSEIRQAALLLNDLSSKFIDKQEALVFCGHCSNIFTQESVRKHHYRKHEGKSLRISSFPLADFVTEKDVHFSLLVETLNDKVTEEKLMSQYVTFKQMFDQAVDDIEKMNNPLTLSVVLKYLYSSPELYMNLPLNIRELILRLVSVSTSEAICESFGSVMETYHERFTNSDIDYCQLQKEMFVNLTGPLHL
jgi:hypothetical protein